MLRFEMSSLLRGRDIKRYSYEFADKYLIATFPSKNYNIDEFPAVKQFLFTNTYVAERNKKDIVTLQCIVRRTICD